MAAVGTGSACTGSRERRRAKWRRALGQVERRRYAWGVGSSSGCDARRGGGTGEGAADRHDAVTDGTRKKMGWVSKRTDHKFARILNTQRWEEKILLKDVYDSQT